MSLDLCLKQLHVVHIKVFLRMQYIRLLLFYSVIFESCKFQSCKFSYPYLSVSNNVDHLAVSFLVLRFQSLTVHPLN